ncbi:LapA family protein [bacterium]|nr:LapA family protein [bacterium]
MWVIKWIFAALLILAILGFALQNQHQMVQIHIFGWVSPEMPLYAVVYLAFAFGMLAWLVASILKILQLKTEIRRIQKKNADLREELNKLRNLPIEEEIASEPKSSSET